MKHHYHLILQHGSILTTHYGEMVTATKSTRSPSYLSEKMSNVFMFNIDVYVAEFERQVEFNTKQSTGTLLCQHSKQNSSCRDNAHNYK
jgi:hypothetical protein